MTRIGLFGGSFNPVHAGHLLVARAAIDELALNQLAFIPAAQSPFKPATPLAPGEWRSRWLRLALAGWPGCVVDEQELRRGGVSYTVQTLSDYAARFPGSELFWLIGSDHLELLPRWRDAARLAELAEFVVVPRPGAQYAIPAGPFRVRSLKGYPLDLSASAIRERIRGGLSLDGLVPPAVADSIHDSGLYLQSGLPQAPHGNGFQATRPAVP